MNTPKLKNTLALLFLLASSSLTHAVTITGTLAWNASPTPNVTYNVYQSISGGAFAYVGNAAANLSYTVNYDNLYLTRWYVTARDANGLESPPSNTVEKAAVPPATGLNFEAESGSISGPFYIKSGTYVQQDVDSTINTGGRAVYSFNVANAGNYDINMLVNAPTDANNSLFVNIDNEPLDPLNAWHIPLTTGFELRSVQWQAETNSHIFNLNAAAHTLVIRGREAGTAFDRISITPLSPPPPNTSFSVGAPTVSKTNALPGDSVDFTGSVRNTGTTGLAIYESTLNAIPPGWNASSGAYVVVARVANVNVNPGTSLGLAGTWLIPTNTQPGLWNSYVSVIQTAGGIPSNSPLTPFNIIQVIPPPTAPAAPQSFRGTALSQRRLRLEWYNQTIVVSTKIERSEGNSSSFKVVATVTGGTATSQNGSWTDSSLRKGREYWYRAQAVNTAGVSPYSNIVYYKAQ